MAVNLFSYQRGSSLLHKCNALAKVFFLTVFCIFIFVDAKWMSPFFIARTAACLFVPLLLLFLSGLSLRIFFNLWPVILTGVFVTAFRSFDLPAFSFNREGFYSGCIYALNFFMAALASGIVFKTTSPLQIREGLCRVEDALAKIFPFVKKLNLALAISLTINFLPSIFEYWNKTGLACKARLPSSKKNHFGIRIFTAHLSAFFSCLLYRAETSRRAVLNRS